MHGGEDEHRSRRHRQQHEERDRHRAREIDERQEDRLRIVLADVAGRERADDVEEADQRQRPGADPRVEAAVDDEGRQVRGDEGDVKAADEEAGGQQQVAPMREGLRQRLAEGLLADRLPFGARAAGERDRRAPGSPASRPRGRASASAQPKFWISAWPKGAKTNWPIEPAAVPMPKTIERFSGGTRRPKAASTMREGRGRHAEADHQSGRDVAARAGSAPRPSGQGPLRRRDRRRRARGPEP